MRPNGVKLSRRHRTWVYSIFLLAFFSGFTRIILRYAIPKSLQIGNVVHVLKLLALKVHGAAAMLVLVILGTLIPLHMKRGWTVKLNRSNGIVLISVNLGLITTGYLLYYAGGETFRNISSWIHMTLGVLLPGFLVWHIAEGRLSRKKRQLSKNFNS